MKNKEFIPYELALAFKELGFDEPCLAGYRTDYKILSIFSKSYNKSEIKGYCIIQYILAPLYQQAFRWFREKYSLYTTINYDWNEEVFRVKIMKQNEEYKFYEEAELECLKQLIKIVKNESK